MCSQKYLVMAASHVSFRIAVVDSLESIFGFV